MKIQSFIHYGTGIDSFVDANQGFRCSLNNTNKYHQFI